MQIKQTVGEFHHGHGTIGTDSAALTVIDAPLSHGVYIKASSDNTDVIYVGGPSVTSSNGYILDKGEEVFLPVEKASQVYVVGGDSGQKYNWIGA